MYVALTRAFNELLLVGGIALDVFLPVHILLSIRHHTHTDQIVLYQLKLLHFTP